ncbi:MAG: MFS transporter [Candidatus Methanoperedens sp.]|nr:MFS transporter [Candidatus Methanoperedens sp.]
MKIHERYTLWVILASATLTVMAGAVIAPVLPWMGEGLGVSPASAGLIITTHGLFTAIFSPLFGTVIDRMGPRKPYIFGLILFALAGGAGLFITSFWVLIISRAFLGIGVAAFFTSITVIILNLYEGTERNKVMGWRASANSLGFIWPLIGGFLGSLSWHYPFGVYLLGIPLGVLGFLTIPETQRKRVTNEETSLLLVFRKNPLLFAIYGLFFLTNIFLYVVVIYLPVLLRNVGISDSSSVGMFLTVMMICAGLTSLNYGKIRARLSYKKIVLTAALLWIAGFAVLSYGYLLQIIAVSVAFFGIGQGMVMPAVMVWAGETVSPVFRGRVVSYLGTFGFIGQFLSPIIFGAVFLTSGLSGVFLAAGSASVLLFLLFLVGLRK